MAHPCVLKTENWNKDCALSLQSVQVKKLDACIVGTHTPPSPLYCSLNSDFHLDNSSQTPGRQ